MCNREFVFEDFISTTYTINNNSPSNNNKKEEERKHKAYSHNPYNGVVYNDIILATGVFSSKELWKMSKGESEELNPLELTNRNCFPASILQDTSENTMGSNASSSSNGSTNNITSNIKIENPNTYYCNSYSNSLQNLPPPITAIAGGYSEFYFLVNFKNLSNCQILVDTNSGFSVILRPGEQLNSNNDHDSLTNQRYATHSATRLVTVSQSRQDEVLLNQQQHSSLAQQGSSPGSVFYQHSPSTADGNTGDNHNPNQEGECVTNANGSTGKYSECQTNGHDTLSDFVTFVCQETEQGGQSQSNRHSPKNQQYPQYNSMLPPPPLPPMARPVAIIRSSDLTMVNSPPTSITPPTTMSSPLQEHQEPHMTQNNANQSPPLSPQSQMDRKGLGLTRIASPYSNGRDYAFNHFHPQQSQVKMFTGLFKLNSAEKISLLRKI